MHSGGTNCTAANVSANQNNEYIAAFGGNRGRRDKHSRQPGESSPHPHFMLHSVVRQFRIDIVCSMYCTALYVQRLLADHNNVAGPYVGIAHNPSQDQMTIKIVLAP